MNTYNKLIDKKVEIKKAFIDKIDIVENNRGELLLKIEISIDKIKYIISNIKASEWNMSLLWRLRDTYESIDVTMVDKEDYIILIMLGQYVALIETEDNTYIDVYLIVEEATDDE